MRRLNGPQTTGREYRNLSEPAHRIVRDLDVPAPMSDGVALQLDVLRPDGGPAPALIAASPYPRQMQNLGLPAGFVEAGASDFWVPRGYAHVLANERGTGGSGGVYGFYDERWRRDMHDLVEWTGGQPWCDGNVGMLGISAFAIAQIGAAVERPPHLRAIFPFAATVDLHEAVWHGGLLSTTFVNGWISGVAGLADKGAMFRGVLARAAERVLKSPPVHARFEHFNGEAALAVLGKVMKAKYEQHPWEDLYLAVTVEHQTKDAFWAERDLTTLLDRIEVPTYLGCGWDNVPLHLPGTFQAFERIPEARMSLLEPGALAWPWESLHLEALAWYDHWLKGRDTGILEGPRVRYQLGAGGGAWAASDTWPPPGVEQTAFALAADGVLGGTADGERTYVYAPESARLLAEPSLLAWDTGPLDGDLAVTGAAELELDASVTGEPVWIATLQDVAPNGSASDVTAGWLCGGDRVRLVDTGHLFRTGHRIRLVLASDDGKGKPAMMGFRHAIPVVGSRSTIRSASRLLLPIRRKE